MSSSIRLGIKKRQDKSTIESLVRLRDELHAENARLKDALANKQAELKAEVLADSYEEVRELRVALDTARAWTAKWEEKYRALEIDAKVAYTEAAEALGAERKRCAQAEERVLLLEREIKLKVASDEKWCKTMGEEVG